MSRFFGKIKMTWPKLLIFALIAGVYTGMVMCIPTLDGTSLQDIGITYEWWVLFAVIVVTNCGKWYDAMLKCFVFFLISQPLVYAVQVVCGCLGLDMAIYYYTHIWLPITILTLPGGFIAYFCKKQNVFGSLVLGIGCAVNLMLCVFYSITAAISLPHHLLTAVYCFVSVIVMAFCVQKSKRNRIITLSAAVLICGAVIAAIKYMGLYLVSNVF